MGEGAAFLVEGLQPLGKVHRLDRFVGDQAGDAGTHVLEATGGIETGCGGEAEIAGAGSR